MSKTRTKASRTREPASHLNALRKGLQPDQVDILNTIWNSYLSNKKWPSARVLHSQKTKKFVKQNLQHLGGVVREAENHQEGSQYELTAIGILLTVKGHEYTALLCRYLEHLRDMYKKSPNQVSFTGEEVKKALNLSKDELGILGELIKASNLNKGGSYGDDWWSFRAPDEVEDLPPIGALETELDGLLFRNFDQNQAVYLKDRQQSLAISAGYTPFASPLETKKETPTNHVDALKRRYQVFISSTYEDLKEERQHVIQALLETKCIPIGMELFPAASVDQWELIKRIINECDYYVVIVAGRYGSTHKSGVSYTEMEFDYALSIGKPVIGFYYKNPDNLRGSQLEKTSKGRKQLAVFTSKVKSKVCRPWTSPAELGSAVKSAVLNELEFNPKPGWVRANDMPSTEVVDKLKQRIADLEEKLKKGKRQGDRNFPDGKELVTIRLYSEYDFSGEDEIFEWNRVAKHSVHHEFEISWDEFLLILADSLQKSDDLKGLCTVLVEKYKSKVETELKAKGENIANDLECEVYPEDISLYLDNLIARKLVREVAGKYGSWATPRYQLTQKGLQYRAELRATKFLTKN